MSLPVVVVLFRPRRRFAAFVFLVVFARTRRRSLRLRHVRLFHQFGLPHPLRLPYIYPVPPSANILISPSVAISGFKDRSNDELGR